MTLDETTAKRSTEAGTTSGSQKERMASESESSTMPIEQSLTGKWVGEYFQHDQRRPITAVLLQEGEVLTGSMSDGEPEHESSLSDLMAWSGEAPGADEQIAAKIREIFPDTEATPIRYFTQLPPISTLKGWIRDSHVYFLKCYEGPSVGGYKVGDQILGRQFENHSVEYSGKLRPDGVEIEGHWWIDGNADEGIRRTEGSFVLRLQQEIASSDPK
jgi:hypothetical protein